MARPKKKAGNDREVNGKSSSRSASSRSDLGDSLGSLGESHLGRWYWVGFVIVLLLLAGVRLYRVGRPYSGLHSWASASGAWAARSHVHYGLGYTRGLKMLVVGHPPPADAQPYVSHPQLGSLITAFHMWLLGTEGWLFQLPGVLYSLLALAVWLLLVRRLADDAVSLLSGLFIVMFPLTGYFGSVGLGSLLLLWGFWRYLILIGELSGGGRRGRYLFELGACFVLLILMSWSNVFYVFTIGVHYGVRCIVRREKPSWSLAAVLALGLVVPVLANLAIMVMGYGGNAEKIVELYQWRAAKGEREVFQWQAWFGKIIEHAVGNFSIPVLVLFLGWLAFELLRGVLVLLGHGLRVGWRVRHLWYFAVSPILFLFALKGLVWEHQYWQGPFVYLLALGAAGGTMLMAGLVSRYLWRWGGVVVLVAVLGVCGFFCHQRLMAYYEIRWQSERTLAMFEALHDEIPPEKSLLTFKDFMIKQHKAKPGFYRPEYAWYLDRPMIVAQTPQEVLEKAATGEFPIYYIPDRVQPLGGAMVPPDARRYLRGLSDEALRAFAQQGDQNRALAGWEWRERQRRAMIAFMKQRFEYRYFENPAPPGDPDYCYRGNTPAYLFDLTHPRSPQVPDSQSAP